MKYWVILVLLYGICNGLNKIFKKKAMVNNSPLEVLVVFTTISFILSLYQVDKVLLLNSKEVFLIFIKSLIIFVSWLLAFIAIDKLSVSLYTVINMSSVFISTLLAIIFLNEKLELTNALGMMIIVLGVLLANIGSREKNKKQKTKYVLLVILSTIASGFSGILDKVIMQTADSGALQVLFMFMLTVMYWAYIYSSKTKVNIKSTLKNGWVYILAIVFVIGDKALFIANGMADSKVTTMILLKQISVVIAIFIGGKIFKEKQLLYKFLCALIVLSGILLTALT